MSQVRHTGVVTWFDSSKGYGFINVDTQERDAFLHVSNIAYVDQNLEGGDRVEFIIREGERGLEADEVRRL